MNTTDRLKSCVDPYVDSFAESFAASNYKEATIKTYRNLVRKLGRLMDTAGIVPAALTPDLADHLARKTGRGRDNAIRFYRLARRFAEHLIDIGVAQPEPLTEAQVARAALLAEYESYLLKQRGLSPRTVDTALRFANRFLDHRFGTGMMELKGLRAADAIGFVGHLLAGKLRADTRQPRAIFGPFSSICSGVG